MSQPDTDLSDLDWDTIRAPLHRILTKLDLAYTRFEAKERAAQKENRSAPQRGKKKPRPAIKREKAMDYILANPSAKNDDIACALECDYDTVVRARRELRKRAAECATTSN